MWAQERSRGLELIKLDKNKIAILAKTFARIFLLQESDYVLSKVASYHPPDKLRVIDQVEVRIKKQIKSKKKKQIKGYL